MSIIKKQLMKQLLTIIMAFFAVAVFAQQKTVSGTVTSKTGEALTGVSVHVGKTTVATDANGKFTIPASAGDVITLSYVGKKPITYTVTDASQAISLVMEEAESELNTVIVSTGYKSERKVDLTGAVSVVNLNTVKNSTATSPMLALQGSVPGLYIQTDGSPTGGNGGAPTILIRGVGTLNSTNPLYIIDGVPTTRYEDFANLNTGAISSMQVLKDASAASIYGSRAANGVIIVTTKNGSTDDKIHVQLNSSLSVQTEKPWQEHVLNSHDRGAALWRAAVNDGTDPNSVVDQIYKFDWNGDYNNPVLNNVIIAPFVGATNNNQPPPYDPFTGPFSATDSLMPSANTNWQDALYKQATVSSNDLAVTGGNSRNGFLIGLGYYNNNGLIEFTNYRRYNARINSHASAFNDRLKFGENFQVAQTSQVNSTTDVGGASTPGLALTLPPTIPLYKTDGTYGGPRGAGYSDRNNPVDMQYLNRFNTRNQLLLFGNVFLDFEILKNLVFHTSVGFDYSDALAKNAALIGDEGPVRSFNSLSLQEAKDFSFTWTNTLNYNLVSGQSRFNILLGTEAIRDDYSTFGAANTNFALQNEDYLQLSTGVGSQTTNGTATGYRLLSQFGKLFYGFADKYLASFTLRRDGSSRFGANNQYGLFPAFTLGWRLNNENFLKDVDFLSNLKLRAGVGTVGNQQALNNTGPYTLYQPNYGTASTVYPQWLNVGTAYDLYGINTGTLPSGFVQVQQGNPNLKWESSTETNLGVDFGFLKESITGSFDYFIKKTKDILIIPPTPGVVGEGQTEVVNGADMNDWGWEAVVSYNHRSTNGLSYTITANAAHFENKITSIPDNYRSYFPGDATHSIVGRSPSSIFGYKTDGLFPNFERSGRCPYPTRGNGWRTKWSRQNKVC